MTGSAFPLPLRPDSVSVACGLAVVTGIAAIVDPPLSALTLVLVALGVAAFLLGMRSREVSRLRIRPSTAVAFSTLGLGTASYFLSPPGFAPLGAFLLALSTVPLWWVHYRASPYLQGRAAG